MSSIVRRGYKMLRALSGNLHGEISLSGILFRRQNDRLCGALGDFDYSTSQSPCSSPDIPSSPGKLLTDAPFISLDLLVRPTATLQCRHDLESLLYAIVWYASRCERENDGGAQTAVVKSKQGLPLEDWGDPPDEGMFEKARFLFKLPMGNYSKLLRGEGRIFVWWVHPLRMMIMGGMAKRASNKLELITAKKEGRKAGGVVVDEETLGGSVTLDRFIGEAEKVTNMILFDKEFMVTDRYLTEMGEVEKKCEEREDMNMTFLRFMMGMEMNFVDLD